MNNNKIRKELSNRLWRTTVKTDTIHVWRDNLALWLSQTNKLIRTLFRHLVRKKVKTIRCHCWQQVGEKLIARLLHPRVTTQWISSSKTLWCTNINKIMEMGLR